MAGEKILIVEDEKIISLDLQRRLEKFGYDVCGLATSGEEAIEKAESLLPHIVLMDIMLTGTTDGIEAAKIVNKQLQIPVIFLTAYADEKTLERAKEAEPFGYILKPFKEKELYTTIDIALYKHQIDKKLKKQERRVSAILHSIEDGIIATNGENRIQFMNPVAEDITGWSEEEARNNLLEDILTLYSEKTEEKIKMPHENEDSEKGPLFFKNTILENHNGEIIPVEGTVAKIRDVENMTEGQVIAIRDLTEMREMSDKLSYQASHDALTGLMNRNAFSQNLTALIESAHRENREHALLYVDLDQFKLINDTVGHAAGDELLIEATSIIKTVFRSGDICARIGGDEFGILLTDTNQETALNIAQRLHNRLSERKLSWGPNTFNIHSSIGLVMIDNQSKDIHSILAAADDACFLAKEEGGKRIKMFETSNSLFLKRRGEMQWVARLTGALEEDRFELYFQPIIDLKSNSDSEKEIKSEILVRMIDEENNIVQPADFLPAAERYNMMPAVDRWVVRNAMHLYNEITKQDGKSGINRIFAINLSAESMADEDFLDYIYDHIEESGIKPQNFCFEITETVTITNMATASRFIRELKDIGCTFALDDFGSGFSSFGYLKDMPVDFLKIDGSFVKDMDENPVNCAMVEAINNLGHVMGIKTIAEFARSQAIIDKLRELQVDFAQGYEIGRPKPLKSLLQ
jgi:diguanylate cyclase (GGDEF)-like protein/PAS domain S-box-containing protein